EPTVPPLWGAAPATGEHLLFDAELKVREKKLIEFVTAKHRDLVAGARARAGEYLLAVWSARNQPPADDFMLLADRGDLNPTMVIRWRQHLDEAKGRRDPVWVVWHALAALPEDDFADRAAAVLKEVGGNRLVREAFAVPPKTMKEAAERYGKLLAETDRRWQEASAGGADRLADADAE